MADINTIWEPEDYEPEATPMAVLKEVRAEISRINQTAGETIFNPAITDLVDAVVTQQRNGDG